MYLRTTQRRRKDGSSARYVQLAHNRRVNGVTQAEVLVNLGREEDLDLEGLRRLAASIGRYCEGDGATGELGSPGEFDIVASRPLGGAWLLDGLWRQLGVGRALGGVLGARRFTTDVERVLFALVANRALAPASKLAAAEWASQDAHIPGLDGMDEDQAYRAMDLLVEADTEGRLQEAVFFACADLLNLEVDVRRRTSAGPPRSADRGRAAGCRRPRGRRSGACGAGTPRRKRRRACGGPGRCRARSRGRLPSARP